MARTGALMEGMSPTSRRSILRREAVGSAVLIILIWAVELFGLPHRFFGEPAGFLWSRVLLRTAVVLAIWAWVHVTNRRLLQRLHHLEKYLLVCSWCRKVGDRGEWLTMEQYFGARLNTETSHGICPACAAKQMAAHPLVPPVPPAPPA